MRHSTLVVVIALLLGGATVSLATGDDKRFPSVPHFEKDITPILAKRCQHCHGEDVREGRLDLRTVSSMLGGGNNGPVVVRGAPEQSLLLEKITSGEMPPSADERLSAEEIATITAWVKAGLAADEKIRPATGSLFSDEERGHWAFRRLSPPAAPEIKETWRVRTEIDRFLLAKLEQRGLAFSPPVDRESLARRISFDLTGLPPTLEELREFAADGRDNAYDMLVDRLLASPQFGVRWGRHWLDIVGYTDTVSFDEDFGPPIGVVDGKWRYRDYVVDAFNADKPYDRFLLEQLAGDELVDWRNAAEYSPEVIEKLVATGFLRTVEDISVEDPRPFVIWSTVHETVEQTATSLLGLTMHCARCHSHKFEPIPQRDYYSLMAFFTPALNPSAWKNAKQRLLPDIAPPVLAELQKHNAAIDEQVAAVQMEIDAIRRSHELKLRDEKLRAVPAAIRGDLNVALDVPADKQDAVQKYLVGKLGALVKVEPAAVDAILSSAEQEMLRNRAQRIAEWNGTRRTHGWIHAVYDVGPAPPTHLFKRGQFETPGNEVPPAFLRILSDSNSAPLLSTDQGTQEKSGRRSALGRWLTSPESLASGLTARVMVNRVWQHLFGAGLAASSENLGLSGTPPTHPELLDWLAADFRDNGWRLKRLIKQIVLSAAYRQASADGQSTGSNDSAAVKADPSNTLLWRMRLRRLDAEALRDAILAGSGTLDLALSGPPAPLVYDLKSGAVSEPDLTSEAGKRRRSLYLTNRRLYNPTLLSVFDKPSVTGSVCRRDHSATALQSLSLMNDSFLIANAARFAERVLAETGASRDRQIDASFRLTLARSPGADEREWCREWLEKQTELFRRAQLSEEQAARQALASLCQALWSTNDFLYLR